MSDTPPTLAIHGTRSERLRAVAALEDAGPEAGAALAAVLRDRDLHVRLAAADALGRVGDHRVVQPLLEALRGPFTGGAGRGHQWKGVLWRLGMFPLMFAAGMGPLPVQVGAAAGMLYLIAQPGLGYLLKRRHHDVFARAVGKALERVAERHPSGQLSLVVDDLEAVAANELQQSAEGRAAARRTARRIETLTGDLRTLPVAADYPSDTGSEVLPRPSRSTEPAEPAVENLPLPQPAPAEENEAVLRVNTH